MGIPYPDPIRFDHGRADAAIAAINTVIRMLQHQRSERWTRGRALRVNWKGPYAIQQFDPDLTRMVSGASNLITQLQSWVTAISGASARATAEQAAHDRANQQWERENAPDPGIVPGL